MNPHFSDALIRALGWALAHSLWLGALLAFLLFLVFQKIQSPHYRYHSACAALLLFFCSVGTAAWLAYEPEAVPQQLLYTNSIIHEISDEALISAAPPAEFTLGEEVRNRLEHYSGYLVGIWMLGFCIGMIRLAGAYYYLHRLQRKGWDLADTVFQSRTQELSKRLALARPVRLMASALIHTPMTLGHLKPIILLPIGLINQLSVAEVEAILAHELAHIKRQDWLINLLQAFMEALFYYHPAVWWMSEQIRKEREHCCDDIAIGLTENRLSYAKALVQVQELARNRPQPSLSLAMYGKKPVLMRSTPLLDRIKRVLNQSQPKSQVMEKMIATGVLFLLLALYSIHNQTPKALAQVFDALSVTPAFWETEMPADSLPKPPKRIQHIIEEKDDKKVEIDLENGKLTRLQIDGKEVPAKEYETYRKLTDEMLDEMQPAPAPPMPPMPPMPDMQGAPVPPDMPESPRFQETHRQIERIYTDKDDAGNTIIRMDRPGGPTEIKIINDKVYIDGREVENGSSIELQNEIPDMESFDLEVPMPPMPPPSPSDFQMEFNIPDPVYAPQALSPSELEKLNKTLAKAQKEIAKQQKSLSKSQKRMLNDQMQELERIQKENIQIQRDAMRAQRDLLRAQEEARRSVEYARTEAFRAKMQAERDRERAALDREDALREGRIHEQLRRALLTDALITNPDKYNMHLSEKEMRVNGKIQDEAIKKKYLEYYKSISGRTLKNADSIQIEKNHTN